MSKGLIAALLVAVLAAAGGYWAGQQHRPAPDGGGALGPPARQILYYRNPMGLPDTSPTPKKDPMGMDYIPVYAGEAADEAAPANLLRIAPDKIQKLGVRTEPASVQPVNKLIRAVGRVEADERRVFTLAPKFDGYVERLQVNVTGQPVSRGQPLFEAYSPELVSAQREYLVAVQGLESLQGGEGSAQAGMRQLAESSLARLRHWDIADDELKLLVRSGEVRRTLAFRSPVNGIVSEKKAVQGMRFMAGESLFQVTDLSAVWVIADVFEQDIAWLKAGQPAQVKVDAYPGKRFDGTISYIYPTLKTETRTIPVRIELPNPRQLLKPGMFAQLELSAPDKGRSVTVPASAVIDSGTRQIVLVQVGEGRFEPREVRLGVRGEARIEVLDGVRDGEPVVVSANFLIDAESNLKAAIGGFGSAPAPQVGHHAEGRIDEIDVRAGTLMVSHGPVASLKWPEMTMEFKAANEALLKPLKPGARIVFEFVERGQGEWVITSVKPLAVAPAHAAH